MDELFMQNWFFFPFPSKAIFSIPGLFEDFSKNLEKVLPIALNYDHHSRSVQEWMTKQVNKFYFDNNLTRESVTNVTNVSDRLDSSSKTCSDEFYERRIPYVFHLSGFSCSPTVGF